MSNKKGNIMSLSVDPEIQERLKNVAKKRNISVSKLVRDMVDKHLPVSDEDVDTVILRIPHSVKTSDQDLRSWLNSRVDSLVKALITDVAKSSSD